MAKLILDSKSARDFALKVFIELANKYTIALSPSKTSGLYSIDGSVFGDRSPFSAARKGGYFSTPIVISGKTLYLSSDWYPDKNVLCIYDNLKNFVENLTSGRYIIQDDSSSGGNKYVLYKYY